MGIGDWGLGRLSFRLAGLESHCDEGSGIGDWGVSQGDGDRSDSQGKPLAVSC